MQIQNILDTYYLMTAISAVVILTLSFLLASIRLPEDLLCQKFNKARRYLALSYFILGLAGIVSCLLPTQSTQPLELLLITASVASFQSLLFTCTHIIFVQPDVLRKKMVIRHLTGITFYTLLLTFSYQQQLLTDYTLLSAILIPYLAQQIFYVNKFRQFHKECVQQMERYYDEEQEARLNWVNYSFYGALCVGLLSIAAAVTNLWVYTCFIILYTFFYTYMVVLVYNNKLITKIIHPAVIQPTHISAIADNDEEEEEEEEVYGEEEEDNEEDKDIIPHQIPADMNEEDYNHLFKTKLESWIANKGYLQKDLSVDDIATTLHINRDYLRYYFRTYVHSDFRTWRSELRIKEAKKLMKSHPEYTFSKIAEMVGFNHRANFFNQFVKIEGMTPTEWRELKH